MSECKMHTKRSSLHCQYRIWQEDRAAAAPLSQPRMLKPYGCKDCLPHLQKAPLRRSKQNFIDSGLCIKLIIKIEEQKTNI